MTQIYLGKGGENPQNILLKYGNRHGLIAGATGTGKTVTLQDIAEGFSKNGVPVFISDIKGDLSGLAAAGQGKEPFVKRAAEIGFEYKPESFPVVFWDIFGAKGHPIRTTISDMGPMLLARLMGLNDTQEGVLNIAFAVADKQGLLLLDLDDLRSMLQYLSENAKEIGQTYGNVASATVASIQRELLVLEQQGARKLFGEPALQLVDLLRTSIDGRGNVNILSAEALMQKPALYSTFMLWLLAELFENMPEVGDMEKPRLVFFFDEAHLLFSEAPKVLVEKVEQLVKLIRSKGVGVYFITQNPQDIPDGVLAQLGNRVQHALRAFTPAETKAVKAAAQSFRVNPKFKTEEVITQLAVGEALVSTLDEKGTPTIVERTLIRPPLSLVGPIDDATRAGLIQKSPIYGLYEREMNRESAYEMLNKRAAQNQAQQQEVQQQQSKKAATGGSRRSDSVLEATTKSVMRSVGTTVGREIVRGILKGLLK